jgi:thioester reductase-like protein
MKNLIITGGSGFLGSELIHQIHNNYKNIYLITRSISIAQTQEKFQQYSNVLIIPGNLENTTLLDNDTDRKVLLELDCEFIHIAANYDIGSNLTKNYITNVIGIQNIIHFVSQMKNLKRFHFVSSVAVSGSYEGVFREEDLDLKQHFDDYYAGSKFDAESIVRQWSTPIPKLIYRPGIIIGHSESGAISKVDGPYYIFQLLHRFKDYENFKELLSISKYLPIPYAKNVHIPFVPVDEVAHFIKLSVDDSRPMPQNQTYHLTGTDGGVLFENFINQALEFFQYDLKATPLPLSKANDFLGMSLGFPKEILSYMYKDCLYSQDNVKKYYPYFKFKNFEDYSNKFYTFALNELFH